MRDTAIRNVYDNVVTIDGSNAWDNSDTLVTLDEALVTTEVARLQTIYDNNQYQRDRASAYPSLTDQADMAYWDRQNGTTTLDDAITAVKSAYPKT